MRIKPYDVIFLGGFVFTIFKAVKAPKVWYWWLGALVCAAFLAASIFWPEDSTSNSHAQTATTTGTGSTAVNQHVMTSGGNASVNQVEQTATTSNSSNSPVIQVTESTNVTMKINSDNATYNINGGINQIGGTSNVQIIAPPSAGQLSKAFIRAVRGMNIETNFNGVYPAYETKLLVGIHNPPDKFLLNSIVSKEVHLLSVPKQSSVQGSMQEAGTTTYISYEITFYTTEKVQESNFQFFVTEVP